jgi:hypothetical protein
VRLIRVSAGANKSITMAVLGLGSCQVQKYQKREGKKESKCKKRKIDASCAKVPKATNTF